MSTKRKAIFLDRDGTIIVDKHYLNDYKQVELLYGATDGLKKLQEAGFALVVVTNQSGIFRGLVTEEQVREIHDELDRQLAEFDIQILAYYHSPHSPDSDHPMRKPNPGMIELALKEHDLSREGSWMIGDKESDVLAGRNANMQSLLISSELSEAHHQLSLVDCANYILSI